MHWWQTLSMNAVEVSTEASEGFSLQQAAREQVSQWSEVCQRFLDWQNREILEPSEPSAERLEEHRAGLKWLLRFGRALALTASDPDYPDKQISRELNGRLIQLEHSWRTVHERMPETEAASLLREVFPE